MKPIAAPTAPVTATISPEDRTAVLGLLAQCGTDALLIDKAAEVLNLAFEGTHDQEIRSAWIAAAERTLMGISVIRELTAPTFMLFTLLIVNMVELSGAARAADCTRLDALLAAWLRHPCSFGAGHAAMRPVQKTVLVQRVGDLLAERALDEQADRASLARFVDWVNDWDPRNRAQLVRPVAQLKRHFPAEGVWKRVNLPLPQGLKPAAQGKTAASSSQAAIASVNA